jgi:hypothetical protein
MFLSISVARTPDKPSKVEFRLLTVSSTGLAQYGNEAIFSPVVLFLRMDPVDNADHPLMGKGGADNAPL